MSQFTFAVKRRCTLYDAILSFISHLLQFLAHFQVTKELLPDIKDALTLIKRCQLDSIISSGQINHTMLSMIRSLQWPQLVSTI